MVRADVFNGFFGSFYRRGGAAICWAGSSPQYAALLLECRERDSNSQVLKGRVILSHLRLPISPSRQILNFHCQRPGWELHPCLLVLQTNAFATWLPGQTPACSAFWRNPGKFYVHLGFAKFPVKAKNQFALTHLATAPFPNF